MSFPSLERAADECFTRSASIAKTREQHEAAIQVWNRLLDDAIANAIRAKDQYVEEKRYEQACVARDMAGYFNAMKATNDAPFQPPT
ncbi:MAG TPA: hypothetical protein VEA69_20510 [Tepidisphaeraceae bacterium]|nr:hypothetical protein [Tepidisphaeraceae bacterium]